MPYHCLRDLQWGIQFLVSLLRSYTMGSQCFQLFNLLWVGKDWFTYWWFCFLRALLHLLIWDGKHGLQSSSFFLSSSWHLTIGSTCRYLDVAGQKSSKFYVFNGVALFFGWLVRPSRFEPFFLFFFCNYDLDISHLPSPNPSWCENLFFF